jgi:chromosome segregation ATPase
MIMRSISRALSLCASLVILDGAIVKAQGSAQTAPSATSQNETPRELSETQKLRIESLKQRKEINQLRLTLAQAQAQIAQLSFALEQVKQTGLASEQQRLLDEIRKTLGASPSDNFDWDIMAFSPTKRPQ